MPKKSLYSYFFALAKEGKTDEDCWSWSGPVNGNGYPSGTRDGAHRRSYQEKNKIVIPGIVDIHHTCKNKLCVNPTHMSLMMRKEHGFEHRLKMCKKGLHDMEGLNVYIDRRGHRRCRACYKEISK